MLQWKYISNRRIYYGIKYAHRGGGYHDKSLKHFGGVRFETHRGEDAKRHSLLRNILISPLEGEKKFLGELNELRNFREGNNLKQSCRNSNSDRRLNFLKNINYNSDMFHHDKNNKGRLGILAQHEAGFEPSPEFLSSPRLTKKFNPLTKREDSDSVISNNLIDTNHSQSIIHYSLKTKVAFTLAEVLITLGIIGVVSAITLPVLVQNYRKRVVEVRLERVATILSGAIKLAENDYGEAIYWESANSPDAIRKYLMPYIPGSKLIDEGHMSLIRVDTADGKSSMTLNGGFASGLKLKTGEVLQLKNGIDDGNNLIQIGVLLTQNKDDKYISGKDYFTYFIDRRKGIAGSMPWVDFWNAGCNKNRTTELEHCKSSTGHSSVCLMLIECNGWKVPDDYPIKF